MKLLENYQNKGRGHFLVSAEINGDVYDTITTNTMAIDAAYDDCYDDQDTSGRFYENRDEAIDELINEIKRDNEL